MLLEARWVGRTPAGPAWWLVFAMYAGTFSPAMYAGSGQGSGVLFGVGRGIAMDAGLMLERERLRRRDGRGVDA